MLVSEREESIYSSISSGLFQIDIFDCSGKIWRQLLNFFLGFEGLSYFNRGSTDQSQLVPDQEIRNLGPAKLEI